MPLSTPPLPFTPVQVAELSQEMRMLSCLMLLLHLIGLLPFLDISDKLSLVTRTIRTAMAELPSFLAIFTAAFASYAVIGHLLFGPHIDEWVTITRRVPAAAPPLPSTRPPPSHHPPPCAPPARSRRAAT